MRPYLGGDSDKPSDIFGVVGSNEKKKSLPPIPNAAQLAK